MVVQLPESRNFLEWQPGFDLGLPEFDIGHRDLLDLVNRFVAAVGLGDAVAELEALIDGSRQHFQFEHDLMLRAGYDDLRVHGEQHSELLASMRRLRERLRQEDSSLDMPRTIDFLRDWFSIHIVYSDRALVEFLKAQRVP